MKLFSRFTLISLLCYTSFPAAADDLNNQYNQQTNTNTQNLVQYFLNLGGYFGYDLTQSPTANNQTITQQLLDSSSTQLIENYLFNTVLGATPVATTAEGASPTFVPAGIAGASVINAYANTTYKSYTSNSSIQEVTVSPLIDQQTFQHDPVSQSILNILGTPDMSYCITEDGSAPIANCPYLYENLVSSNVIGTLPPPAQFFSYKYNQQLIGQLNSNALLAPLLYSTESTSPASTGSEVPDQQNPGLTAQNQIQQAANFIRYVSGAVSPIALPKWKDYDNLYIQAVTTSNSSGGNSLQQMQAQSTLSNYFANLRVYSAQTSVGMSNLYYILSKRLPQKQNKAGSNATSQALSEFQMATWRLFNADLSPNKQWINQINSASSATIQKEIATLLAEMNYQMYLDRQLQERILLTNTIMLMQNTKAAQPSADFTTQGTSKP